MATQDDDDTVEAQSLSTSLDPYGQLIKMLMPRALCIAIYDPMGMPLWLSDGCDGPDLQQLIEEALNSARSAEPDPEERDGFARSWDGDTAYVFILRDGDTLLGTVAISSRDTSSGSRPFSFMQGLLRPALQVLARELWHQCNIIDLQRDLKLRDSDLSLLLNASGAADENGADDFDQLLQSCVKQLDCSMGVLLIPEQNILLPCSAKAANRSADLKVLEGIQGPLFAWAQVQRRTLVLNKVPPNSPLGTVPYKILTCPIRQGSQPVIGILALLKPTATADFEMRQIRIVELMARRIAFMMQSSFDAATGMLTRTAFEQRVAATLTDEAASGRHCVAYGDVDRLHVVNENYGMHIGDEVIEKIAETIRTSLPDHVIGSRLCGDRFAVFFPEAELDSAQQFLVDLGERIASIDYTQGDDRIELSVSFGLAAVPNTKFPLSYALAAAEVACKAAKDRGRGQVEMYVQAEPEVAAASDVPDTSPDEDVDADSEPVMEAAEEEEQEKPRTEDVVMVQRHDDVAIVASVIEAIATDRFCMEAQPIVEFGSNARARRFELLLRMIDASGENIAPDKFLSAAERHHLGTDIDRWVVRYALEILSSAAPVLQNLGAHFAINLSAQSVADEEFPGFLEARLREYQLPPSLLSFEISESAAVANIVRAETLIRRLQDLGHDIVLDDFGRGLSSLTYLKSLSVSGLKIDGSLMRDVAVNPRSQDAVMTIVQLARSMQMTTTAECVETEAIFAAVNDLGLDYGQGFAIGRPRPVEVVLQELLRGASGTRASGVPLMSRLAG